MMLSIGDKVKVHYTGKYSDGKVFDSTAAKEPIEFTIGDEMMISGFEKAVMTMSEGDRLTVKLKASEAYGEIDTDLFVEVNRADVFGDKKIKKGDSIQAPTDDGVMMFKVHKVNDKTVILDGNSELAGKNLIFDIELINVIKESGEFGSFEDEFNEGSEFDIDEEFDVGEL
ncbi:MAG: peptidylprolyl isomerase [Bacteroidetes bacterium]|nr:MAG: peptidylprolyl isomerase [Bacteroidota bacterium]